jgi:hypothetical protein
MEPGRVFKKIEVDDDEEDEEDEEEEEEAEEGKRSVTVNLSE